MEKENLIEAERKVVLMVLENKKTINTRTQYRIIGSDYSAQEPR